MASTACAVWPHTSQQWFCGRRVSKPRIGASSGRITKNTSGKASSISPAPRAQRMPLSSEKIRSGEILRSSSRFSRSAAAVFSSMVRPNRAAKRSARKMRSASSRKRSPGSPTQRRTPFLRSSRPPKSSRRPRTGLYAMAFTVKSRRARSAWMSRTNEKRTGWRQSE